jgi:hypothetical protein
MFVTILSYCDTEVKKNQLRDLLVSIKSNFPTCKTLVYSHYQNLEPEYYSLSDYYIFDKSNPKSSKILTDWIYIQPQNKTFYRSGADWGYAVLQMIKRSIIYLKGIEVDESLFLNYDCDPNDVSLIDISNLKNLMNDNQIGIFSKWDKSSLSLINFYLKINKLDDKFINMINEDYYRLNSSNIIPEQVWMNIILSTFGDRFLIHEFEIESKISVAGRTLPLESSLREYFDTILPTTDKLTGDKCLAIWNLLLKVDKIKLIINNVEDTYHNMISEEYRSHSFFCELPKSDISSITITGINDFEINPYKIDGLDDIYWNNNKHKVNI